MRNNVKSIYDIQILRLSREGEKGHCSSDICLEKESTFLPNTLLHSICILLIHLIDSSQLNSITSKSKP